MIALKFQYHPQPHTNDVPAFGGGSTPASSRARNRYSPFACAFLTRRGINFSSRFDGLFNPRESRAIASGAFDFCNCFFWPMTLHKGRAPKGAILLIHQPRANIAGTWNSPVPASPGRLFFCLKRKGKSSPLPSIAAQSLIHFVVHNR